MINKKWSSKMTKVTFTEAIAHLIVLTRDKKLIWEIEMLTSKAYIVYTTNYKNMKHLLYYKKTYPNCSRISEETNVLELVNTEGNPWKFPDIPTISDLYALVTYQIEQKAGIEEYLKDFISDEDITQEYKENYYRRFINYLKEIFHIY